MDSIDLDRAEADIEKDPVLASAASALHYLILGCELSDEEAEKVFYVTLKRLRRKRAEILVLKQVKRIQKEDEYGRKFAEEAKKS